MRERTGWIDAARGLAVSLVVLWHATGGLADEGYSIPSWFVNANSVLEGFRMPTVVMISGILAMGVRTWPWREVLRRRVAPLALMYVVWAPIAVLGEGWIDDGDFSFEHNSILLMLIRPEWRMWYFYALLLYIVAARLLRNVPTPYVLAAAVAANFVGVGWLLHTTLPLELQSWAYVLHYWVFFVAAERFGGAYLRLGSRPSLPLAAAATVAFFGFGSVSIALGIDVNPVALLVLGALGSLVTLTVMPLVGESRAFGWARAVGKRTLGVYALQSTMGPLVLITFGNALMTASGGGFVVPIVISIAVVALSYGVARALLRWAPVPFLRPWWDTKARAPIPEPARPLTPAD